MPHLCSYWLWLLLFLHRRHELIKRRISLIPHFLLFLRLLLQKRRHCLFFLRIDANNLLKLRWGANILEPLLDGAVLR